MTASKLPTGLLIVTYKGRPFYEAKWVHDGRQVKRRIGPAHVVPDRDGGWKKKRGPAMDGTFTEKEAVARMGELVKAHTEEQGIRRSKREATFGDAADDWLRYLEREDRKPSTIADYRNLLARPGEKWARGDGEKKARVMRAFGNRRLRAIKTRDIEKFLDELQDEGLSARLVNKHRSVLHAVFEFCRKHRSGYGLAENPVSASEKRTQRDRREIRPFTPEEVAAIVRAAESGSREEEPDENYGPLTRAAWEESNRQWAAMFLVAAETGLRQGELRALRWRDIWFQDRSIKVERAVSNDQIDLPKSGRGRRVPMSDEVMRHLDLLSRRERFTAPGDLVFPGPTGEIQNRGAIYRRFVKTQNAAGVEPRRFHDLRHTYCSRLVAKGADLVTVKTWAGHSSITVTERYLHFRPQETDAAFVTSAFSPETASPEKIRMASGTDDPDPSPQSVTGRSSQADADIKKAPITGPGWQIKGGKL